MNIPAQAELGRGTSDNGSVDFKVLGFYHRVVGISLIVLRPVPGQIDGQGFLTRFFEARKGHLGRAEIFSEEGHRIRWRKGIVEQQVLPRHFEARFSAQTFSHNFLVTPQRRRGHAGRPPGRCAPCR